ncbi:hypothetical protein ACFL5X_01705 [Candidatus Omnitrophota bacterium]
MKQKFRLFPVILLVIILSGCAAGSGKMTGARGGIGLGRQIPLGWPEEEVRRVEDSEG